MSREGRGAGTWRSMARGRSHKVVFYWQKARRSLGSAGDYTWWSYRSRIDKQWYAKREKGRERETYKKSSPNTSSPQVTSIPSYFHCPYNCCVSRYLPLFLSYSLYLTAIPFGYSAAILPAGSRGWSCLRLRLVHRCTHSPPTDDPQCTANSHKAPADTQMDKRIWTYTCTCLEHGSARTFSPVIPVALDARNAILLYSFCSAFVDHVVARNNDIVVNWNCVCIMYMYIYMNIWIYIFTMYYYI